MTGDGQTAMGLCRETGAVIALPAIKNLLRELELGTPSSCSYAPCNEAFVHLRLSGSLLGQHGIRGHGRATCELHWIFSMSLMY